MPTVDTILGTPPISDENLLDIQDILARRGSEKYSLHERYVNPQIVRVLKTIGFDKFYVRGHGPHLFDEADNKYLDLLSGWGVFALGRNHPVVNRTLKDVLDAELPNLGQMDIAPLAGLLAEKLIAVAPNPALERVFFTNSGTEAVEGSIKLARSATRKSKIVFCEGAFHGLSMGSLSLNGSVMFREGFGPFLPGCERVAFNDLEALERILSGGDVAAFIVEPIQGKGVNIPDDEYLPEADRLCKKYGALFIADEIQTGLGRTGRMWAVEHWGAEPDILLCAKALSGGQVPVGAILGRRDIFDKLFSKMDRAVVHSSTFGTNNMAMAAGLATLHVLRRERLIEHSAEMGQKILEDMRPFIQRYDFVKDVRGKGLMIGIEFSSPNSLKLKAAWKLLEAANESLFCQMILIPLLKKHRILAQVAAHKGHVIKILPALVIDDSDREWMVSAFDDVIDSCHRIPGAVWDLGRSLASHARAESR